MGAIHFSIDKRLVDLFREILPLATFFETGTFEGDSIATVCGDFKEVYSVESADAYYTKALDRFRGLDNVHLVRGDSATVLRQLHPNLADASVLYWLDAHWCVAEGETAGRGSQCPLLAELDAIGSLNERSVILIDDARLFLAPPPVPHDAGDWPDFDTVVRTLLGAGPRHRVMVLNDVIVFYPAACERAVHEHARATCVDLLVEMRRSRGFASLEEQLRLEREGLERESSAIREALAAREQEASQLRRTLAAEQQEASELRQRVQRLQHVLSEIERTFWYRSLQALKSGFARLRQRSTTG